MLLRRLDPGPVDHAGAARRGRVAAEEQRRLDEADRASWRRWGPYLAERAWGTVREDYSADGDAWDWFPHDHARSRTYRWNEDGLAGLCDDHQFLCLSLALWNGVDPIMKERVFGLNGPEGNHGEDAKDYWWFLDSTPTHSWMRWRYLYPQVAVPLRASWSRSTGAAGASIPSTSCSTPACSTTGTGRSPSTWPRPTRRTSASACTARNVGPAEPTIHLVPTLWLRNTWRWGRDDRRAQLRTELDAARRDRRGGPRVHRRPRPRRCRRSPTLLFCENETNLVRLFGIDRRPALPEGRHPRSHRARGRRR